MTATFGRLRRETLELAEGLNIIQAPNESGKSTWCAFLCAMLYGVNSRERDRAGFLADKNRFAPWGGEAMEGRLDCRAGGRALTLTRETRRASLPMGSFTARYAGTGDEAPGLTGQNCGETLLGVSREVFERSAFIRQLGLGVTADPELEKRIVALITSGEEETSYTEAAEALRRQLNRRRHNKTGLLPALEGELAEARRTLDGLDALQEQLREAEADSETARRQAAALNGGLEQWKRWDSVNRRRAAEEAQRAAEEAQRRLDALQRRADAERLPENETIARLRGAVVNLETVRKSVAAARDKRDAALKQTLRAESAVNDSPFAGQTAEGARGLAAAVPPIRPMAWWFPVLLLAVGGGGLFLLGRGAYPLWSAAALGGVSFLLGLSAIFRRAKSDRKKQSAFLAAYGAESPQALSALADAYAKLLADRDAAQSASAAASATADALYASLSSNEQGILLEVRRFAPAAFDIPAADEALRACAVRRRELLDAQNALREARARWEALRQQSGDGEPLTEAERALTPPETPRETLEQQAAEAAGRLAAARSAADRLAGQIAALGDRAGLEAQAQQIAGQIAQTQGEYDAIALAMESLAGANAALQNRFSPELGRRAAELFSALTGGRYSGVVLDRSFRLSAEPAGDTLYRDAQYLSAGALDQLYLATRLAICQLVLPAEAGVPLILDDALANFDDARCAAALRVLRQEARSRQILLFTCHTREADFFRDDPEVAVRRLTNGGAGV